MNDHTIFGRRKNRISKLTLWLALACPIHSSIVFGQENTRTGAVFGGLAGAVVGGVVGHNHKDQTAEGALIGGAVGAVAGGLVGNQRDRYERQREANERQRQAYERQRQQFYQQQTYSQPYGYVGQPTVIVGTPAVVPRGVPQRLAPVRRPVSIDEVVYMVRSGVSENVIVAQLQTNGVVTRPDVNEVIRLSQEGVSEYVITAMQTVDVVPMTGVYNTTPSRSAIPASSRLSTNRVPTSSGGHIPSTSSRNVPYNSPTYSNPPSSSGAWNTTPRFTPPPLLERRGY